MKKLTLNTESLMAIISSLSQAKAVIKEAKEESIKALNYAKGVGSEDSNYDFYEMVDKNDVFFMDLDDDVEGFVTNKDLEDVVSKDLFEIANELVNDYQSMFDNFSAAAKIKSAKKSKDLYKNFYFKK